MAIFTKKLTDVLVSLAIFLFIICFAVVLTLNFKPLYYMNIDSLDLPEKTGYSREIIVENYDRLIDYNSIFNFSELEFDSIAMSPEGKIHFEEVKVIFVGIQVIMIVSAIASIIGIFLKVKNKNLNFLLLSSIFTITIPSVLGALIAFNWQWFFITFHEIAFNNDYWIFDPSKDPIITILPNSFFMQCAIMIVSIALLISITMFIFWRVLNKGLQNLTKS